MTPNRDLPYHSACCAVWQRSTHRASIFGTYLWKCIRSAGSPFAQTDCAEGEITTISNIRAGDSIDAFGLTCSEVELVFP